MPGPVEVLDGFIKGIIFATYDFVRLTALGFSLPFFRRTRRIWPFAIAIGKRFSSLTHLVIWVFIVVAFFSGTAGDMALNYFGLTKNPDVKIPALIAAVLLTTMLSDILVRAGILLIGNRTRRKLYEPLARIAVANIFFGMLVVITAAYLNDYGLFGGPFFTFLGLASFQNGWLRYPYFLLFGVPLAIVIVKAFAIRDWKRRVLVGLPVMVVAPAIFLCVTVWLYLGVGSFAYRLSPPVGLSIYQQSMRCSYVSGRVYASGLLKLEGADTQVVSPHSFAVLLGESTPVSDPTVKIPIPPEAGTGSRSPNRKIEFDPGATAAPGANATTKPDAAELTFPKDQYLGRGDESQPPIILSRGRFTSVTIIAAPAGTLSVAPPGAFFECKLGLMDYLSDPKPVSYGELNFSSSPAAP
jgi:hypothetical protein